MGEYGYTYQSYSTYNTVKSKTEKPLGPAMIKPFVPFVPNSSSNPEDYVTRKTVVPIATSPYGEEYSRHVSPTKAYTKKGDDEEYWHKQTSPVHSRPQKVDDFLTKVQNEASRPPRSAPAVTTDWRASPQSTAYNSATGYGDYGNREEHWPIGSPVRYDNHYGNGYGEYGNFNDKERQKPIGSSIGDRNDKYDRYPPPENYSSLEPNRTSGTGWSRPNVSPSWSSFYDRHPPAVSNSSGPKNSSGWTAPPRNGTQLSKPTNDIKKAMGLLKEVARVNGYGDYGNKGRPKDEGYNYNYQRRNDEVDRPNPSIWAEPPSNEPTTPHEDDYDYREAVDTTTDATRRYGNFNFKSRSPRTIFNNRNH